jgi:lipopolysaccharide export LptBFGC system permease protein LptF
MFCVKWRLWRFLRRLMIYRTLHTYILRELLRVFLLTASALTTLMAFGGMFRPVTKQGIDVSQVMVILVNLMPAMLAYAIPIAALFAAVLVYWRMSTDNELTACRAGGMSFISIVTPAFVLGLAVASVDLVFVNYVVPRFLQSTERIVYRDMGSLIVSQVNRQERFQYKRLVVAADSAEEVSSGEPDVSIVVLHGLAATMLDNKQDKPIATVVGEEAQLRIHNLTGQDAVEIDISLRNASGFNPANGFQRVSVSATTLSPDGRPFREASYFKSKAKFLNWRDLMTLGQKPYLFPTVADLTEKIEEARGYEQITGNIYTWWQEARAQGKAISFTQAAVGGASQNLITVQAANAAISPSKAPQEALTFTGGGPETGRVRVEQQIGGVLTTAYTCDSADLVLSADQYTGGGVSAALRLSGNVMRENHQRPGLTPVPVPSQSVTGLLLIPALKQVPPVPEDAKAMAALVASAAHSEREDIKKLGQSAQKEVTKLFQTIDSELHSRGSFSLSCLTLVLLGAALGILMRGKNPLAVFVVGFVPAIILVLLITAGRQLTEGDPHNVRSGIIMIWAGNGVLLAIVAGVYMKLLRR